MKLARSRFNLRQANRSLSLAYNDLQQRVDFHNGTYPEHRIDNLLFDALTRRRINTLIEGEPARAGESNRGPTISPPDSGTSPNEILQRPVDKTDARQEVESFLNNNVDDDLTA